MHRRARDLAREVDQGRRHYADARTILYAGAIHAKLERRLGHFDPKEFAQGLYWTLDNHIARLEQARMEICDAIRAAVHPLFKQDATKDEIEEAAIKANADRLPDAIVAAILWQERTEFNRHSRWQG